MKPFTITMLALPVVFVAIWTVLNVLAPFGDKHSEAVSIAPASAEGTGNAGTNLVPTATPVPARIPTPVPVSAKLPSPRSDQGLLGRVVRQMSANNRAATDQSSVTVLPPDSTPMPVHVKVVSSSTKKGWLNQAVEQFNAANMKTASGRTVVVEVSHARSGSSMNDIFDGKSKPVVWSPGDQSWVTLINENWRQRESRPIASQICRPTVYAPIGFAMWRPMAEALGWPDKPIGWGTIAELAANPSGWATYGHPEWGQFRFGHPHPAHSNTGLLSMTAFVYGILGVDSELSGAQIYQPEVENAMRSLEQNTSKYGRGSTPLFDLMVEQGPRYVHAIAASEETTLRYNINHRDALRFPLAFIFPSGGTIWADHPYCILDNADWVSAEEEEAATIFRDYILAPERQALAVVNRLRPTDDSANISDPISFENGTDPGVDVSNSVQLPSPDAVVSAAVIDLFMITKRKATVVLALDTSGSMMGNKMKTATEATADFLSHLDPDDEVTVLTFDDEIVTLSEPDTVRNVVEELAPRIRYLTAEGSTALHEAVCLAASLADELQAEDEARGESRLYGIVLLSDGEDSIGQPTEHQMFTNCLPANAEADGFKIFPIAFGDDANDALLSRLALATGGRLFTADPDSIGNVYFTISAEQ
ncbi:MAG: substrate-binding domain-containing protein [SAR202 cluster bacterium]|nr:substrate-binding domain-containing protein [SAR202 cluster bacterium]MDP6716277.1 substrate-binding domain-containing protein [SAR202 cluster bacterium]